MLDNMRNRSRQRRDWKRRKRNIFFESLEKRIVLASAWTNPLDSLDVNQSRTVSAIDALVVINDLARNGQRDLPETRNESSPYVDTNLDGQASPRDALFVINAIARGRSDQNVLQEDGNGVQELRVTVGTGQDTGVRSYRFGLEASFDETDDSALIEDTFAVYVVDPNQPDTTLLAGDLRGGAAFTLSGNIADFAPGYVTFDGENVELDLSSIVNREHVTLVFQLINLDSDDQSKVKVDLVSNEVDPEGRFLGGIASREQFAFPADALDTNQLVSTENVELEIADVRLERSTRQLSASIRAQNTGDELLGRDLIVAFPGNVVANASGSTEAGHSYVSFRDAIPSGGLRPGVFSNWIEVAIDGVTRPAVNLVGETHIGATNRAPQLSAIDPITIMPGEAFDVIPSATDPDDDDLTFTVLSSGELPTSLLLGNGTLQLRPTPDDIGEYRFHLQADDGASTTQTEVVVNVVQDTIQATRVSGKVLNVDGSPLSGLLVEIGTIQTFTDSDGVFLLNLGAGIPATDTLRVRGELYPGDATYPFIAERLPLMLEQGVVPGINNIIHRPIYLPQLDMANGVEIDPNENTTVTTEAIPGLSVEVAAGTLLTQQSTPFDKMMTITEVPVDRTPASLPENLFPDIVVTIQPGEMQFTTPAPMTFPNTAGYRPGLIVDLWSINPTTGEFQDVGDMRVSDDGQTVETISGGIRFSSWHFVGPDQPGANGAGMDRDETGGGDGDKDPFNPKPECNSCPVATRPLTSEVELHSGALRESHPLVTYQSQGQTRGVTLHYNSEHAHPQPIVHFSYDNLAQSNPFENTDRQRILASLRITGPDGITDIGTGAAPGIYSETGGENFWRLPETGGDVRLALQADLLHRPTGLYRWSVVTGVVSVFRDTNLELFRTFGNTDSVLGSTVVVNRSESKVGAGWGISGVQELVRDGYGGHLLLDGNGDVTRYLFRLSDDEPFRSPPGDFSTLRRADENGEIIYTRTTTDRTVYKFREIQKHDGTTFIPLLSVSDRNGNETRHVYEDGFLTKIIDPVGQETTFGYENGSVRWITDPAERVTELIHNDSGDLVQIIDPDGSTRTFGYDEHRLTTEINERGFREQTQYGFHGRVIGGTQRDGTRIDVSPAQTRYVLPIEDTNDALATLGVAQKQSDLIALASQPNGAISQIELYQGGELKKSSEPGSVDQEVVRRQGLLSSTTDPRGFQTEYTFDGNGNLQSFTDAIVRASGQSLFPHPVTTFSTAIAGASIYSTDINSDQILDVVGLESDGISIALGLGDGTFAQKRKVVIESLSGVSALTFFDYNADESIDIAAAKYSGEVVVLEGGFDFKYSIAFQEQVGSVLRDIESVHVDANGFLDLVVTDVVSDQIIVLYGDENGAFNATPGIPVGEGPTDVAIENLNHDGFVDLVTTDRSGNTLSILNGIDGSNFSTTTISAPFNPTKVVVEDVTGDAILDLIVAGDRFPNLALFAGLANGGFDSYIQIDDSIRPEGNLLTLRSIAILDINNDGTKDIVGAGDDQKRIYLNDGEGNFVTNQLAPDSEFSQESGAFSIATGDLNGDGTSDLLFLLEDGYLSVVFGADAGDLKLDRTFPAGSGEFSLGDFNGDTLPDVVTLTSNNEISLHLGDGAGGFAEEKLLETFGSFQSLDTGDFNGDGLTDLVVKGLDGSSSAVSIYHGNNTDSLSEAHVIPIEGTIGRVVASDFNGDGVDDIGLLLDGPTLSVLLSNGIGQFSEYSTIPIFSGFFELGDFNGDDVVDIVFANGMDIAYAEGQNDSAYNLDSPKVQQLADQLLAMEIADFNGDGFDDVAAVEGNTLSILLGSPTGLQAVAEKQVQVYSPVSSVRLIAGELNEDGQLDLLVHRSNGTVSVLIGNGDGSFTDDSISYSILDQNYRLVDVNRDEHTDIVGLGSNGIKVTVGNGDGTFDRAPIFLPDTNANVAFSSDLNADQKSDVVVFEGAAARIYLGRSSGQPLFREQIVLTGEPHDVAHADFNDDGLEDFAIAIDATNEVQVFLGSANGGFYSSEVLEFDSRPDSIAVGHFDDNTTLDLVVLEEDSSAARLTTFPGNGNGMFAERKTKLISDRFNNRIVAGDLNGDRVDDIALVGSHRLNIWAGTTEGTIGERLDAVSISNGADDVEVADFNGDGIDDLAVATNDARVGTLLIWGNVDGDFSVESTLPTGPGLEASDLNGDGLIDLAIGDANGRGSGLSVFLNAGTGSFHQAEDFLPFGGIGSTGRFPGILESGDFNGDGAADLLAKTIGFKMAIAYGSGNGLGSPPQFSYDTNFNQLIGSTDELGRITLYEVDPTNGNRRSIRRVVGEVDSVENRQSNDLVTTYVYTSNGLLDMVTDDLGRITGHDYDFEVGDGNKGFLRRTTFAIGTADEAAQWFEYDRAGNQTAVIDENGNRTEYIYNLLNNRLLQIIEPDPDGDGPLQSPVTKFTYDARGNLKTTTDARSNTTENVYDSMDRIQRTVDADEQHTLFDYDVSGNLKTVTDPLSNRTRNKYDTRDRLTETIDAEGGVTKFRYDVGDNLVALTDPVGNTTSFVYDARNRLVREVDPFGETTRYEYDPTDNLVRKIDRNDRVTEYTYDDLNRLDYETWLDPGGSTVNTIDYEYDKLSNLLSVEDDDNSRLTFTYDARNRVKTVSNSGTVGVPEVLLTYSYDSVGNVLSVADDADGGAITGYEYDALNRVKELTQSGANTSEKLVDFVYNELGQFDLISRYSDLAKDNLVAQSDYDYDPLNRLKLLQHGSDTDARSIAFYDFEYDDASRITEIEDVDGVTTYSHDDRSQLTGADRADTDVRGDESYEYDANGNRVNSHLHGTAYETGPGNRLLSDGTYRYFYDDEGNMIRRTVEVQSDDSDLVGSYRVFDWDHRNRLVAVTDYSPTDAITQEVTYRYDALNRRIAKSVDGGLTYFIYDREDVILDYADPDGEGGADPTINQRYLHGPGIDQVLAQENGGGAQWLLSDHLGTTRDIVDTRGGVLNRISFDGLGNVLRQTQGSVETRYLFTGREFDSEIGLTYFRARLYDPIIGRFITEDPVGQNGNDDNRYRYVANAPTRWIDPTGLIFESPWDAANVAAGAASLGANVAAGNYVGAGVDAAGLAIDATAALVPGVPAGAAAGINAARACKLTVRYSDEVAKLPLRHRSLTSGSKRLRGLGLRERITKTGRHEFVDKNSRVRAAWDAKNSKGGNHWHKFAPDGQTPLADSGRVVGKRETAAHIPSK